MSLIETSLYVVVGATLAGVVFALLLGRWGAALVGLSTAAGGVGAVVAGAGAAGGARWAIAVPAVLPFTGLELSVDPLSGWFLVLVGAVSAMVGIYTIGYVGRSGDRPSLALLPAFTGAMVLVPLAASLPTLLAAWELMAVTSLLLVLTEHRHSAAVRAAAVWYAVLTQAGFVALLIATTWLASATGGAGFAAIRAGAGGLHPGVAGTIFVLLVFAFAGKAGAVPLHPWLPRAHAESPSHVSALMSAAMVKLGIYGIIRFGLDLLGGGASWWWLLVAVLGAASALYGITQAVVTRDIKRMLAFSTSENVGLILLGVGFAGLYARAGNPVGAALALTAALLHTANHAAFKALLFAGAGSVVRATGTRDLDRLGGLVRVMPATTLLFGAGALAAAALPPGNGFVSEWLLLQSLLHPGGQTLPTIAAPIAVAVVAASAGIGIATYVKALGTGFLARPRSPQAAAARESSPTMIAAMALAALACVALALVPSLLMPAISRVAGPLVSVPAAQACAVRVSAAGGVLYPLWTAMAVVAVTVVVAAAARAAGRRRRRVAAWDCGDGPLTARMQYTATSFAEPMQRVFGGMLGPEQSLDAEPGYHVADMTYRQRVPDRIEDRVYRPLLAVLRRLGERARALASGGVHAYLGYMLAALVAVLLAGAMR